MFFLKIILKCAGEMLYTNKKHLYQHYYHHYNLICYNTFFVSNSCHDDVMDRCFGVGCSGPWRSCIRSVPYDRQQSVHLLRVQNQLRID